MLVIVTSSKKRATPKSIRQTFPEVEPGDRPALPVGYRFGSSSRTDTAKGLLWITVENLGRLGAGLSMYTVNHRKFGAWRYTLPVGGKVTDYFSAQSVSGSVVAL